MTSESNDPNERALDGYRKVVRTLHNDALKRRRHRRIEMLLALALGAPLSALFYWIGWEALSAGIAGAATADLIRCWWDS